MGVSNSNKIKRRIGIIGLGSIGSKHVKSLIKQFNVEIIALRTRKGNKRVKDCISNYVTEIKSIDDFSYVDSIIISNPTSLHKKTIQNLLHLNKNLFIEKPLTNSYETTKEIFEKLKEYQSKVQIGFCLRYHPVIKKLKEVLDSKILGNIYHAKLNVGQYLPNWHPYTDYKSEYFSRKDLGGGSIRTLSHEIDLSQFLFGNPLELNSYVGKVSNLEIDVDDLCMILLKYENMIVRIEADFLQKNPVRKGIIIGTDGDVEYDVFENYIRTYDSNGNLMENYSPNVSNMYENQMLDFLKRKSNINYATIEDSLLLMKIISESERSSNKKSWIKL